MSKFWPPAAPHYLEPSYNPAPHDLVLIFETLDGRGVLKTSSNTIEPTVFSFFCPKVPPWMGRVSGLPPGRETPTPNAHTAVVIYWYLVPGTRYQVYDRRTQQWHSYCCWYSRRHRTAEDSCRVISTHTGVCVSIACGLLLCVGSMIITQYTHSSRRSAVSSYGINIRWCEGNLFLL